LNIINYETISKNERNIQENVPFDVMDFFNGFGIEFMRISREKEGELIL
jgi:hypothetical protein